MKQEVDFIKFSPTQNMTILVKMNSQTVEYERIASQMMSYDHVYAEQVGFIEKAKSHEAAAHLQMAGGEFCGNACMALAVYLASEQGLEQGVWQEILLESSGTDRLIRCQVRRKADEFYCQVMMPIPERIEQKTIKYDGDELDIGIIRYQDFIHIVIEVEEFSQKVKEKAQSLAELLGVTVGSKLIGILLYKSKSGEMAPLIYVPLVDSMVWERGCGSGTASLGAYLAWKNEHKRNISATICQPGGEMKVVATCQEGNLTSISIEGGVGIVAQGKAFIQI